MKKMASRIIICLCLIGSASAGLAATSVLPAFPKHVRPWPEYAAAREILIAPGTNGCVGLQAIKSGNWAGLDERRKILIGAIPELMSFANIVAQYFPVRLFLDPSCKEFETYFQAHPGINSGITIDVRPSDWMWIRDYGPFWLEKKSLGHRDFTLLDLPYLPNNKDFTASDEFPTNLAQDDGIPHVTVNQPEDELQGGDFQADSKGNCFYNNPIDNPADTAATIQQKLEAYPKLLSAMGCRKQIKLEPLPLDGTGHVDMEVMIAPKMNAFVADFDPKTAPEIQAIMERNDARLRAAGYHLHFLKSQSPVKNDLDPTTKIYFSYANSLLNGEVAFVPQYGSPLDALALDTYREAGFKAVPVPLHYLPLQSGSLHCVTSKSPIKLVKKK